MKQVLLFSWLIIFASYIEAKKLETDIYRRNSLCQFFISEANTNLAGLGNAIKKAYVEYKIPDKFNDHSINNHIMSISDIEQTKDDEKYIIKKGRTSFGKALVLTAQALGRDIAGNSTIEKDEYYSFKVPAKLYRFCLNNKIANYLIAKWFNASNEKIDGSYYNMGLIQERGAYNANELEKLRAQESIRGMSLLMDAGEELIPNTYVTFTMFSFESISKIASDAKKSNNNANIFKSIKETRALGTQLAGKSGFNIVAYTYLFKLKWTEKEMNNFYNNYYNETIEKLLNSKDFELEYLGYHRSKGWFMTKSENQFDPNSDVSLLQQSAYRAMEKSFAELMTEYEDFRVKAPLIEVDGNTISSYIGLKEGVNKKSQFEVLMREYNPLKNKYIYKKVGSIKVDKKRIWDNRYTIEGVDFKDEDSSIANENVDRTYFLGNSKDFAPGMLIRQIK